MSLGSPRSPLLSEMIHVVMQKTTFFQKNTSISANYIEKAKKNAIMTYPELFTEVR